MMNAWGIVFALLVSALMVLDRNGTVKRKGWRIYFDPLSCPHCKTRPHWVRRHHSSRVSKWGGGWTCQACGAEVDSWGHLLSPPAPTWNKGKVSQ
jgi:hypothetical protein